jgi:hypothetical protein
MFYFPGFVLPKRTTRGLPFTDVSSPFGGLSHHPVGAPREKCNTLSVRTGQQGLPGDSGPENAANVLL